MNHTEEMIPKLSGACYAIRSMVPVSNINALMNLLCIPLFYYKMWNLLGQFFKQWGDFHFTKENH
jgi:hypothetical protein